jgi:hypothetical protein
MTSYTHGRHIAIPEKSVFRLISRHLANNTAITASAFNQAASAADASREVNGAMVA